MRHRGGAPNFSSTAKENEMTEKKKPLGGAKLKITMIDTSLLVSTKYNPGTRTTDLATLALKKLVEEHGDGHPRLSAKRN
jgi:hypothetical protein